MIHCIALCSVLLDQLLLLGKLHARSSVGAYSGAIPSCGCRWDIVLLIIATFFIMVRLRFINYVVGHGASRRTKLAAVSFQQFLQCFMPVPEHVKTVSDLNCLRCAAQAT
jgi:hypothetical protein